MDQYNQGKSDTEKLNKSSGIDLQRFLVPRPKARHRRSFTNQLCYSRKLEEIEQSFKIGNESERIKQDYEPDYHREHLDSGFTESPQRVKGSNTENDYSHFYRNNQRIKTIPQKEQLVKMKKILKQMGRKLESHRSQKKEKTKRSEEYSKLQLHEMLTRIVDQLIQGHQENTSSSKIRDSQSYKTFIELNSDKYTSTGSYYKKNPRGYHGFLHEDIIRSIVKLEEMIKPSKNEGLGEMGIIDRDKKLINDQFSEMSARENITSILGDSISRVKGLTGEMDWNKPFNQKTNDLDSLSQNKMSMSQAQKQLDDLLERHLQEDDSEEVQEMQKQKVREWEESLQNNQNQEKPYKTVNLDRMPGSMTKFKKKRTSQRYFLNSEDQVGVKLIENPNKIYNKVFTFNQKEKMTRQEGAIFRFSKKNLEKKDIIVDIQIPSIKNDSSIQESLGKVEHENSFHEIQDFRKIKTHESKKSLNGPDDTNETKIIDQISEAVSEQVQIKIYPESKSTSKRVIPNNWSVVNNTTDISLKVLDSRKNMSMIHNINFSKVVDTTQPQKVPFNSRGPSLNNSKRIMVFADSCTSNVLRGRVSESAEKKVALNPIVKTTSVHQSSRVRRINDLKDQRNKQNFMQKLFKKAGRK